MRIGGVTGQRIVILTAGASILAATDARLLVGDDVLLDVGTTLAAGESTTINADYTNADAGTGARIDLDGTIDSVTNYINGERDDDVIDINVESLAGHTIVKGDTDGLTGGEDLIIVDQLPSVTTGHDRPGHVNADGNDAGVVRDTLDLDGRGGTDNYVINITGGRTDYIINVQDSGAPNDGADRMTINGLADDDVFLLRKHFIAYLTEKAPATEDDPREFQPEVERINYDQSINGRVRVNAGEGNDEFYVDDNSAIMTLDGGQGDDFFQVGQVFGTNPNGYTYADGTVDPRTVATDFDDIDPTSDGDDIVLKNITRGWLSNGITMPMVIFGGEGQDVFNVYSNKALLRMEGEQGNDNFVIRAFIAEDDIIANGGGEDDSFQYNINAPVSINGGEGFDTVSVLGTEKADNFLITADGIFGAGLNVNVDGVEELVEVDGLEGDDNFFILSNRDDVVNTIIGGLGSDTFNVGGDVTKSIISQTLDGRTGVINHGAASDDGLFDKIPVNGIQITIADENTGLVVLDETDGATEVTEDSGIFDSYSIYFAKPGSQIDDSTVVYITVSAVQSSTADKRRPIREYGSGNDVFRNSDAPHDAESVLISVDGGATWTPSAVLTFSKADGNWDMPQEILVQAAHDDTIEGERKVMISHSLIVESDDPDDIALFTNEETDETIPVDNVEVRVLDDDIGTLLVRESDNQTMVLEGGEEVIDGNTVDTSIRDTYDVRLSVRPDSNVTVKLDLDEEVEVYLPGGSTPITEIVFTPDNYDEWRTLEIRAVDDADEENPNRSRITHTFESDDEKYQNEVNEQSQITGPTPVELDVTVHDNDTPRVIVYETEGNTKVVAGQSGDEYTLRLSTAPTSDVTVTLYPDGQTYFPDAATQGITVVDVGDPISGVAVDMRDNATGGLDTITRVTGSFLEDGFQAGDVIEIKDNLVTTAGPVPLPGQSVFTIKYVEDKVITLTESNVLPTGTDLEGNTTYNVRGSYEITATNPGATGYYNAFANLRNNTTDVRDTITRTDGGNWVDDGIRVGALIEIGTDTFKVNAVTDEIITLTLAGAVTTQSTTVDVQNQAPSVTFT
ncbi:MAG: hypothetical protein HUJ31_13080, partial [Pseudomonadales bacterium]|nr:hypothetical protein [Pseudomonadales bacterium]